MSLIVNVRNTLSSLKIMAPLLVVKGDGSLLKAEQAIQRPVETILSGPAASILGATVGNKKIMVQAADIYTTGLGGDSQVQVVNVNLIDIGPRRGQFAVFWQNPKHHLSASEQLERDDRVIEGIYLNTELFFKAAGRPAGANRHLPK